MNSSTEISPSTQLFLAEMHKLFDEQAAKWDRRFAEMDAAWDRRVVSQSRSVRTPAAAIGANVTADDWGGLFDGGDAADGPDFLAPSSTTFVAPVTAPSAATLPTDFVAHAEQERRAAISHSAHFLADTPTLLSARAPTAEHIYPDLNVDRMGEQSYWCYADPRCSVPLLGHRPSCNRPPPHLEQHRADDVDPTQLNLSLPPPPLLDTGDPMPLCLAPPPLQPSAVKARSTARESTAPPVGVDPSAISTTTPAVVGYFPYAELATTANVELASNTEDTTTKASPTKCSLYCRSGLVVLSCSAFEMYDGQKVFGGLFSHIPVQLTSIWLPSEQFGLQDNGVQLRHTPWLSVTMVENYAVRCSSGRLWKPPWPVPIHQQIKHMASICAVDSLCEAMSVNPRQVCYTLILNTIQLCYSFWSLFSMGCFSAQYWLTYVLFEIKSADDEFRPFFCHSAIPVHLKTSVSVVSPTVSMGCMQIVDDSSVQSLVIGTITSSTYTPGAAPILVTDDSSSCDTYALLRQPDSAKAQKNLQMHEPLCSIPDQIILIPWKFWPWFSKYTSDMFMQFKVPWSPGVWACTAVVWIWLPSSLLQKYGVDFWAVSRHILSGFLSLLASHRWYDQSKLLVLTVSQLSSSSSLCLASFGCSAQCVVVAFFPVKWSVQLLILGGMKCLNISLHALKLSVELRCVPFKAFSQHTLWFMGWLLLKAWHGESSTEFSQQSDEQFKQSLDTCCLNVTSVRGNFLASLFSVYCTMCCPAHPTQCSTVTDKGFYLMERQREKYEIQIFECHQKRDLTLSCKYVPIKLQKYDLWTQRSNILAEIYALNLHEALPLWHLLTVIVSLKLLYILKDNMIDTSFSGLEELSSRSAGLRQRSESRQQKCGGDFTKQIIFLGGMCRGYDLRKSSSVIGDPGGFQLLLSVSMAGCVLTLERVQRQCGGNSHCFWFEVIGQKFRVASSYTECRVFSWELILLDLGFSTTNKEVSYNTGCLSLPNSEHEFPHFPWDPGGSIPSAWGQAESQGEGNVRISNGWAIVWLWAVSPVHLDLLEEYKSEEDKGSKASMNYQKPQQLLTSSHSIGEANETKQ